MEEGVESEGLEAREAIGGGCRWPYEGDGTKIKLFLIMNLFIFISTQQMR